MHPHEALVRRFFDRLAAHDAEGAAACYHPDVFYSDPLFPRVRGALAADLWRMRLTELPELAVRLEEACGDAQGALARWELHYAADGRRIAVAVRSMFAFRDGRIARHYDHFSLWRWAARAHGTAGAALGWFGPYRWAVRRRFSRALERFSDARD
jgi:ketosteroid isomerase-like protein